MLLAALASVGEGATLRVAIEKAARRLSTEEDELRERLAPDLPKLLARGLIAID